MQVTWTEQSCCGAHRNGVAEFADGESLHIQELDSGASYAVRAIKDGVVNVASARVPGGLVVGMSKDIFDAIV